MKTKIIIVTILLIAIIGYIVTLNLKLKSKDAIILELEQKYKLETIKLRDSLFADNEIKIQSKITELENVPKQIIRIPYKVTEYKSNTVIENLKELQND